MLFFYVTFIVAMPRIYAGLHFPSDVFVGGLIGVIIPIIFMRPTSQLMNKSRVLIFEKQYPYLFYPVLFLITMQSATIFGASRAMVGAAYTLLKQMVN